MTICNDNTREPYHNQPSNHHQPVTTMTSDENERATDPDTPLDRRSRRQLLKRCLPPTDTK